MACKTLTQAMYQIAERTRMTRKIESGVRPVPWFTFICAEVQVLGSVCIIWEVCACLCACVLARAHVYVIISLYGVIYVYVDTVFGFYGWGYLCVR